MRDALTDPRGPRKNPDKLEGSIDGRRRSDARAPGSGSSKGLSDMAGGQTLSSDSAGGLVRPAGMGGEAGGRPCLRSAQRAARKDRRGKRLALALAMLRASPPRSDRPWRCFSRPGRAALEHARSAKGISGRIDPNWPMGEGFTRPHPPRDFIVAADATRRCEPSPRKPRRAQALSSRRSRCANSASHLRLPWSPTVHAVMMWRVSSRQGKWDRSSKRFPRAPAAIA